MAELATICNRPIVGCFSCGEIFVGEMHDPFGVVTQRLADHVNENPACKAAHDDLPTLTELRALLGDESTDGQSDDNTSTDT